MLPSALCRNYVVQFILELNIPSATASIVSQFEGKYVHLSIQKFSSHVVEKCLSVLDDEHRSRLICELLSTPHFEQLLQDPHANYVVQSALKHSQVCNTTLVSCTQPIEKDLYQSLPVNFLSFSMRNQFDQFDLVMLLSLGQKVRMSWSFIFCFAYLHEVHEIYTSTSPLIFLLLI